MSPTSYQAAPPRIKLSARVFLALWGAGVKGAARFRGGLIRRGEIRRMASWLASLRGARSMNAGDGKGGAASVEMQQIATDRGKRQALGAADNVRWMHGVVDKAEAL